MFRTKALAAIPLSQILAISVLSLAIFLVIDYGQREAADRYVSQAERDLQAQIAAEADLHQELLALREYVNSPEYVERWAREQANMVLPGDRPVILMTPQVSDNTFALVEPQPVASVQDREQPNWVQWWALFFDREPSLLLVR
jgi:hypothetical protein